MLPDRVSNPGPLTYESGALLIALRGPAILVQINSLRMVKLLICIDICRVYSLFILLRTLQFYTIISDNVEYKSLACTIIKLICFNLQLKSICPNFFHHLKINNFTNFVRQYLYIIIPESIVKIQKKCFNVFSIKM